jgi:arylsulfatase A-like enzyme
MSRARAAVSAVALLVVLTAIAGVTLRAANPASAPGTSTASAPLGPLKPKAAAPGVSLVPLVGDHDQPNVVVIMSDDARDDDLRFMPNVRHLIGDKGVRFTNMFSPQPLCCPARASFVTGEYSHNHHVWSHVYPYGFRALHDQSTVPVWLQRVGYNTIFLGKYLNGYGVQKLRDGSPSLHYVPPGWTDWRGSVDGGIAAGSPLNGGTYRYFDTTLNVNGRLEAHHRYQTRVFSHLSQNIFSRYSRSTQPFFYWASFVAPHQGSPKEADDPPPTTRSDGRVQRFRNPARPADVWGRFDSVIRHAPGYKGERDVSDKPFFIRDLPPLTSTERAAVLEDTRQRAEALSVLDDEIGAMMKTLKRTGELRNTYVMFTSDNGYFLGEHRMRQGKILPYEPSLRVPLVIRGPGIPHGEVRTDPATMIDFAPTFLDIAGAGPEPTVDGVSLLRVAKHGDRGWTRGILTETGPRAVRGDVGESDNFLVKNDGPSPLRFSQGVRTKNYLYVEHASHEKELYDLRTDPGELTNLVHRKKEQGVVAALAAELDRLRNCKAAQCRVPLPHILR